MQEIVSHNERSFIDELMSANCSIDQLWDSALLSGVSVDNVPSIGTKLYVEDAISLNEVTQLTQLTLFKSAQEVIQEGEQNIVDLVLQETGNIANLWDFC